MALAVSNAAIGTSVTNSSGGVATLALTTNVTIASGDLIVVHAGAFGGSGVGLSSVSGGGLTWTVFAPGRAGTVTGPTMSFAYAFAPSGLASGTTITATYTSTMEVRTLSGSSLSGVDTGDPIGVSLGPVELTPAGTNWTTGSGTIEAGSLLMGAGWAEGTGSGSTASGSSTNLVQANNSGDGYGHAVHYRTSTGAVTGTWGGSALSVAIGLEFRAAAGTTDATVTAVPADGTGDIPVGTVRAGSTVTTGPADGTGDMPTMTVSGSGNVTITAVIGDGVGDIPTPVVRGSSTVTAPVADATGDIVAGFPVSVDIGAAVADGTGDIPTPTITVPGGATVTAVPADGTGDTPVPTVRGSVNLTPGPADGIGYIPGPLVDDGVADVDDSLSVPSMPTIPPIPSLVR